MLCTTLLLISLDNTVLNVALPTITRSLGASSSQLPYAPLPTSLQSKDQAQLATMVCNGASIP